MFFLLGVSVTHGRAASQLGPFYEAVSKGQAQVPAPDLFKVIPSEEIPVMIGALTSGNPILMNTAAKDAATILRIHKTDGENPHFRVLHPPLATVMREYQILVPVLLTHFDDLQPVTPYVSNGNRDYPEIEWKANVVQLMDVIGAPPSSDMLAWMLKVIAWPNGRMDAIDRVEAAIGVTLDHDALVNTIRDEARDTALRVAPVLGHLNPMPLSVWAALWNKIDDNDEPQAGALIIQNLVLNSSCDRTQLTRRLVAKALDEQVPATVRVAAIYGIGKGDGSAGVLSQLAVLPNHANEKIADAARQIAAGVSR